jgi:hypothetical protein
VLARLGSRNLLLVDLSAEERFSVVVTDHDAFDHELIKGHAPYGFDTRNRLRGPNIEQL